MDRETLEKRRRCFLYELADYQTFPDAFEEEKTYANGDTEMIPTTKWQKARYFLSLPIDELLQEFLPSEVFHLQSMFRADGAERLYGSMVFYFMQKTPGHHEIATVCAEGAAFYDLGLDIYLSYVMKRSFIGIFARYESYSSGGYAKLKEYIMKMITEPQEERLKWSRALDVPFFMRKAMGEHEGTDPFDALNRIPGSIQQMTGATTAFNTQRIPRGIGLVPDEFRRDRALEASPQLLEFTKQVDEKYPKNEPLFGMNPFIRDPAQPAKRSKLSSPQTPEEESLEDEDSDEPDTTFGSILGTTD